MEDARKTWRKLEPNPFLLLRTENVAVVWICSRHHFGDKRWYLGLGVDDNRVSADKIQNSFVLQFFLVIQMPWNMKLQNLHTSELVRSSFDVKITSKSKTFHRTLCGRLNYDRRMFYKRSGLVYNVRVWSEIYNGSQTAFFWISECHQRSKVGCLQDVY